MKYFFFSVANKKITSIDNSAKGDPEQYINAKTSISKIDIFYRFQNGVLANIMCEAENLTAATKIVRLFLATYHAD